MKIKVIEQIPINLKEETDDAIYDYMDLFISLNLRECKCAAKDVEIDFYEYVARCINHEVLHHILHMEHDYNTCHRLDSLCRTKQDMCIKYWLW